MSEPTTSQPAYRPVPPPPPKQPALDSVQLHVQSLLYNAAFRAYGLTRVPGSVYRDENGEVA